MYKFLFIVGFTLVTHVCQSQDITVYKTFGGLRFERDTLIISAKQVQYILEENPTAFATFKKARLNSAVASVLGFTGGLLIGVPLGTAILGGEPEWGLALGGAALLVTSIPFNRAFKRHAINAVDIYNQQPSSSVLERTELFWTGTGLGIRLRF
jgi:hypothetical protein